jgi:succinate dehydrogenase/fumarate reductase-like Fe-S protein
MTALNSRNIHLSVQRGIGNSVSHSEHFEIPEGVAASLLDGLRWIRANVDDTLAFRFSCINANACKECMMRFDGKVVYACLARLQPGAVHEVAPLANKPRVRDLIAEVAPVKERLFIEGEDDGD